MGHVPVSLSNRLRSRFSPFDLLPPSPDASFISYYGSGHFDDVNPVEPTLSPPCTELHSLESRPDGAPKAPLVCGNSSKAEPWMPLHLWTIRGSCENQSGPPQEHFPTPYELVHYLSGNRHGRHGSLPHWSRGVRLNASGTHGSSDWLTEHSHRHGPPRQEIAERT